MSSNDSQKVIDYFAELERLGSEVLAGKNELVLLDKRKQKTREALRAIGASGANKSWMCIGKTFIKLPSTTVRTMLESDVNDINVAIEDTRQAVKNRVDALKHYEGLPDLTDTGFRLNALTSEDASILRP
uniref:P53 and DNA damage-regulated protein 1 n=1 Tax=Plectus sambesii TaxID=2011161 RepID=A0A914V4V6_9BILA